MTTGKKEMVFESIHCYHTGEALPIGRWKVDSPYNLDGTLKRFRGILYIPEYDTSKRFHFFRDRITGMRGAVVTDNDTGEKRPFEMSLQQFRADIITKTEILTGIDKGAAPYGFIGKVHGKRFPKPLNL